MKSSALKKLTSPKKKKPVVSSKRATSFAQLQLGDEPQILVADKMDLIRAFNWYNVFADDDQRLGWLLEHMRSEPAVYSPHELKLMEQRGRKMTATHSYLARLLQRGVSLDDAHKLKLLEGIKQFLNHGSQEIELDADGMPIFKSKRANNLPKVQTGASQSLAPLVGEIEDQFELLLNDEPCLSSCFDLLQKANLTSLHANELKEYFARTTAEFQELVDGKALTVSSPDTESSCEQQLQEAYSYLSVKLRRKALGWLQQLLTDLQNIGQIKRAVRKQAVRRRKPTSAAKMVSRLKFQTDSKEFKVVSVPPEKIIGAKALLVFNTKYRLLSIYEASDLERGLDVKGTTLHGFSEASSKTKKIRAPESVLPEMVSGSRIGCRTIFNNLKTKDIVASGRINNDTILLKVFG
jgi:hypothetical protein